ncbi:hypothetical protein [Ferruginibacter sp. SUN106]|uniref:hypothetical protein n=1 Tax=Ferruginibacter sp. SUN106 TaxID=2978348 RepID=UPI003D3615DC
MRYTLLVAMLVMVFVGCKKDKFTTVPQISFKSVKPNAWLSSYTAFQKDIAPVLTINVTDAEGDLGFKAGSDTSKIYVKNLINNKIDSSFLPDLKTAAQANFKADIDVNLFNVLGGKPGVTTRPRVDTLYFEVYIKDFAKNKSNVIITGAPVYYIVQ